MTSAFSPAASLWVQVWPKHICILCWAQRFQIERYRVVSIAGLAGTVFIALLPLSGGLACLLISLWWAAVLVFSGLSGVRTVATMQQRLADGA